MIFYLIIQKRDKVIRDVVNKRVQREYTFNVFEINKEKLTD